LITSAEGKPDEFRPAPSSTKEHRKAEQLKEILGSSDAEWEVLCPKIERILTLQHDRERFVGKPKLPKLQDQPTTQKPALSSVLDAKPQSNKDSPATSTNAEISLLYSRLVSIASSDQAGTSEMTAALRDYRAAQTKSDAELAKARNELRELVTVKQEIVLVLVGVLD
jgi:hypothetical protein